MLGKKAMDKTIYQQLKQKDKDAFIKAYDMYLESIYRFIYFKVNDREEAEDITSQTFLKVWDYIRNNQIDEYKSLKALLYKVARNTVIDHYRVKTRQQNISLNTESDNPFLEIVDEKSDPAKQIEIKTDFVALEKAMSQLKDDYRDIIILRYLNEFGIAEIAEALGKSRGSVRVQLLRALNALKDIVNERHAGAKR